MEKKAMLSVRAAVCDARGVVSSTPQRSCTLS